MTLTYFWGHGGQFKHDNFQFSLVNTITQQILIALGPNLYHGCISRVSWLISKMDDLDLFWRSRGQFKHENFQFPLVNTITQQIIIALGPNSYHGCISRVSWLSSKMDDLDLFLRSRGVNLNMKIISACKHDNSTNNNRIGPKLIPWMYFKSVLVKFEDGWPWPIFWGHGGQFKTWKFTIFACKHDNSSNNNRIGPKLMPCMYLKSVLVKFEDGWPWPIF